MKKEFNDLDNLDDEVRKCIYLQLKIIENDYALKMNQISSWEGVDWDDYLDFFENTSNYTP